MQQPDAPLVRCREVHVFLQDSRKQANIYFSEPPFIPGQGHSAGWNTGVCPEHPWAHTHTHRHTDSETV